MTPTTYSFWTLLHDLQTDGICIPMLQRDYAQGRTDPATQAIRQDFLEALRGAVAPAGVADSEPGPRLDLDFVYGTCEPGGPLVPLDGQQRLTTLFLLHWYLAAAAGQLDGAVTTGLRRFRYETRAGARDFCHELAGQTLAEWQPAHQRLSEHLRDAAWFQPIWRRDATVGGMLEMLDAIYEVFADTTPAGFQRLTWPVATAPVTFQYLPLAGFDRPDDLYVRMNARGKPLSELENWRARFDQLLRQHHPAEQATAFAECFDGAWTEFFWRNSAVQEEADPAELVDRPFKRYLDLVTRLLWLRGLGTADAAKEDYAESVPFRRYAQVYADSDPDRRAANLHFLTTSLNVLAAAPPSEELFQGWFAADRAGDGRVRLFTGWGALPKAENLNLFHRCCQRPEPGTITEQILFYAVLAYAVSRGRLQTDDDDLRDLLRVVRNRMLCERWQDLFSLVHSPASERLPRYLAAVDSLLETADGSAPRTVYQVLTNARFGAENHALRPEHEKARLLASATSAEKRALQRLEDHEALRGDLRGLDLEKHWPQVGAFADAMEAIWHPAAASDNLIIRAWLALGDYSVTDRNGRWFFGGHDYWGHSGWASVLTTNFSMEKIREGLPRFLDRYGKLAMLDQAASRDELLEALVAQGMRDSTLPDWCRHFIRYPAMVLSDPSKGPVRGYFDWRSSGYEMRQLTRERTSGWHINPYVRAVALQLEPLDLCNEKACYSNTWDASPLWYKPVAGGAVRGVQLWCRDAGWHLVLPAGHAPAEALYRQCAANGLELRALPDEDGWMLTGRDAPWDRVAAAVAFSRHLALPDSLVLPRSE